MIVREDVESLFHVDRVPGGLPPIYDVVEGGRIQVDTDCRTLDEVRDQVVRALNKVRPRLRALRPFTLMKAHEEMANKDLVLRALLVNWDCAPLLRKVARPVFGIAVQIFVHDDVEPGDIFGLAEPDYLGVVAHRARRAGVLLSNPAGVVWGRFRSV